MHRIILFILLISHSLLIAQSSTKTTQKEGLSTLRLEKISDMINAEIDQNHIPGAVALVSRNGKIVYHEAFGTADASGKKLNKNAIFRIASQTKAITSTAVMMLWEEAKFRLDDPISKYIPEFKNPQVLQSFHYSDTSFTTIPANREITIRDLLTHQSGLGYGVIDGDERMRMIYEKAGVTDLFTSENISIKESVMKLSKLPLHAHPGEKYIYSEGLDVLGYFIEVVSGMPLDEFMKNRIFEPLNMNDTYFYIPDSKKERLVNIQHKVNGKWENFPITFYDPDYPIKGSKTFFSGGAGLSSTAEDYAKFLQMYINKGKLNSARLLSRTTIDMMMKNQTSDLWAGSGRHHGLAFGVLDEIGVITGGKGGIGTFDWGGYFNTQYFADPEENLIGIIMKQTQGNTGDQSSWKFRQLVFASIDD